MTTVPEDQDAYRRARQRVRQIRGFYAHVAVFVAVNVLLHLLTMPVTSTTGFIIAALDDTCGNLIRLTQLTWGK